MQETDEEKDIEYFKELARQADAAAEKDLLYFMERLKDSEANMESDLRYFAKILKEDEHILQEGVCPSADNLSANTAIRKSRHRSL